MRSEYVLDYGKARPNRFAKAYGADLVTVVLDPDVAAVFATAESVNSFLRSAIAAMPERKRPRARVAKRKR
jgi:hypothetical protein